MLNYIFAAIVAVFASIVFSLSLSEVPSTTEVKPSFPREALCESVPNGVAINPREDWTPQSRPAGC